MRLPFGFDLRLSVSRTTAPLTPIRGSGGWIPVVREPYPGAWQRNEEITIGTPLANPTVFACTSLISADIGKCRMQLVQYTEDGVWEETTSPAFSPVLRKPNRYQIAPKFYEQWMLSKLVHGNTYVLKERDDRNVVKALYVLDPTRVTPLIAPDGGVYYQLGRDDLAGLTQERLATLTRTGVIAVPASELIHDVMVPLYHPLVGVSPIFACAVAALEGLRIAQHSAQFFANGSQPGGVLTAPAAIDDATAQRMKTYWEENFTGSNVGKVAVLGDGLKYEPMSANAVDSQLIEQLKWTTETICGCYHVPAALVDASHQPPYGKGELLTQQYYSQCLQSLMTCCEASLDHGLELPAPYGTAFDLDDLIWFDAATRTASARESISAGALSPNEARKKYFDLGPVAGGGSPYMQQQYYSLEALAARDAAAPAPPAGPPIPPAPSGTPAEEERALSIEAITAHVARLCDQELAA